MKATLPFQFIKILTPHNTKEVVATIIKKAVALMLL